ncbi:alpha/beta hydrolase, partial [Chryseobacterium balustinum]
MKNFTFILIIFLGIQISAQQKITVWQKGEMPNSKGLKLNIIEEKEGRITQIQEAELFAFLPAKEERKPMAIIIIPGGGYRHLTYDFGGYSYAKWLNTLGISAFVLNYRLPTSPDLKQREIGPLQDIQAAIKLIRKNAAKYGISSDQIGVLGTSAGGHLAAMVSNTSTDYTELKGNWENYSTIPNFTILVSPVIDLGKFAHKGSRDNLLGENASAEKIKEYSIQNRVTEKTPPTILF